MRQHIVPEHYLKGFCAPQPAKRQGRVVWEFRLKDDAVGPRSPKNVGRIRDYYSIARDAGVMDPTVETVLARLESGWAPVIARLRTGSTALAADDRRWLAGFIAFQMVRAPAFRDHVEAVVSKLGLVMLKAMGRHPEYLARKLREVPELKEEEWTPEKVEEFARLAATAEEHYKITATPEASLSMMPLAGKLMPYLLAMRWEFLRAGGKERFVTSDMPVTLWHPHTPPGLGVGLGTSGVEVTVPICPSICLRARHGRGPDPTYTVVANDDAVRTLNLERVRHAQVFVVGDSEATVKWSRRRYKELVVRGKAHARPGRTYIIDGTGEQEVVLKVDVDQPTPDSETEAWAPFT